MGEYSKGPGLLEKVGHVSESKYVIDNILTCVDDANNIDNPQLSFSFSGLLSVWQQSYDNPLLYFQFLALTGHGDERGGIAGTTQFYRGEWQISTSAWRRRAAVISTGDAPSHNTLQEF
jgi:hypothetical protein